MNLTKKERFIGIILAILILLTTLNSAYFFTGILNLNILEWLTFNACSFASIVYLICFILHLVRKNATYLAIPLLPLYYYGTMGLFVMSWNEANIFAHVTHVIITINIVWLIYFMLRSVEYKALRKGLLISILVFIPVIAIIQTYSQSHMAEFMQILQSM